MCCAVSDLRRVAALALVTFLASCGSLSMQLPPPFLEIEKSNRDSFKATTPDEARLWIREFDDSDLGDAAHWSATVAHDFESRGYVPDGEPEEVRDADGRVGVIRSYMLEAEGRPQGYMVAVFVRERWLLWLWNDHIVRVVEFVAPKERFDELLPVVREALATLEP